MLLATDGVHFLDRLQDGHLTLVEFRRSSDAVRELKEKKQHDQPSQPSCLFPRELAVRAKLEEPVLKRRQAAAEEQRQPQLRKQVVA